MAREQASCIHLQAFSYRTVIIRTPAVPAVSPAEAGVPLPFHLRYRFSIHANVDSSGSQPEVPVNSEQSTPSISRTVLGLDMGGTHTDAVILVDGRLAAAVKVPTDHTDLLASTKEALQKLFARSGIHPSAIQRATFGTTLAVNAVVQNACAPVGLLVSAGPGINPAWFSLGDHAAVISGGIDHRGTEIAPLDQDTVYKTITRWKNEGIKNFACVSKFSTRNPAHEDTMEKIIRDIFSNDEHPVISTGHRLSGSLNFPRRIATAYWNAAVWALHGRFADAVEASLHEMGIQAPACLLKADGGAIPLASSRTAPVEALLSGPAASVMGILALMPFHMATEDLLILDMGGTTTDIALLAHGQPLLAPRNLVINGRSTLVRALQSVSIGLGGDSLLTVNEGCPDVGPLRKGPAAAFGGAEPTFLDALNLLGHAQAGDCQASRNQLTKLAAQAGFEPLELANQILEKARYKVADAVQKLLHEVNSQPVYTLAALLEDRRIIPSRAVLVGGPAQAVAPLLGEALGIPVSPLSDPELGPVTNAIGAALARTTASLELFADTASGNLLVPSLGIKRSISRRYSLDEACIEACSLLREQTLAAAPDSGEPLIDIVEAQAFATLDDYGRGGRDIRVRCQLRPGVDRI